VSRLTGKRAVCVASRFEDGTFTSMLSLSLGRVRGKMRFWVKNKYGEKKSSREKLICGGDSLEDTGGDGALVMVDGG